VTVTDVAERTVPCAAVSVIPELENVTVTPANVGYDQVGVKLYGLVKVSVSGCGANIVLRVVVPGFERTNPVLAIIVNENVCE